MFVFFKRCLQYILIYDLYSFIKQLTKMTSQLFIALDDMSKRIPVVKLERVETVYSDFKNTTHKSLVSNNDGRMCIITEV
jgi:hypothetical protein